MKGVKKNLPKQRKEYLTVLLQQTDISEAEAVLEDMAERLKNIRARLEIFLHKLNVIYLKSCKSCKNILSIENCSKVLPNMKLAKIILLTFSGNVYEQLKFKNSFREYVHDNANLFNGQRLQYFF